MKQRIVEAAADEFAKSGFAGARIENVAREAGCNRALVYFYFKDKAGLFQAALDAGAEERMQQMAAQPQSLAEALTYWFRRNLADPRRLRLVMQEALSPEALPSEPSGRADYLEQQLAAVKAFQARGLLRADVEPRHLLTAILALTSFPAVFPRVAETTLAAEDEEALEREWSRALGAVAALLSPPPADDS